MGDAADGGPWIDFKFQISRDDDGGGGGFAVDCEAAEFEYGFKSLSCFQFACAGGREICLDVHFVFSGEVNAEMIDGDYRIAVHQPDSGNYRVYIRITSFR